MNTQEKAEQYAEAHRCTPTNKSEYCKHDIISAYNNGYLEGQADIKPVLDKIKTITYAFMSNKIAEHQGVLSKEIQDFIESLNIQN